MKLKDILWVLFISILPIVELRGAIPVGAALGLPFYVNYLCAAIGNLLPIPFILLFIPKILDFMARFKFSRPIVEWLRKKALKNSAKIAGKDNPSTTLSKQAMLEKKDETADTCALTSTEADSDVKSADAEGITLENTKRNMPAGAFIGLMLFVLIPVPGTGAWTGSLVAALFNYPKRKSFLAIALGVIGCGIIMSLASYGVLGFLKFLL